jgi:hypothetical protein
MLLTQPQAANDVAGAMTAWMGHREKCGWRDEAETWVRAQREQPSATSDDLKGPLACTRCNGCVGHADAANRFRAERHGAPPLRTLLASDLLPPSAKSASPTIGRTTFVMSTPTAAAPLPRPAGPVHTRHAAFTAGPPLSKSSIATSVTKRPRADEGTGRSHDGDVLGAVTVGVGDAHTSCSSVLLDDSQRIVAADDPNAPCTQATKPLWEQSPAANL